MSAGGVDRPWKSSPQQVAVPSSLSPQLCTFPAEICKKVPAGEADSPESLNPQQVAVPSTRKPQVCPAPAEICVKMGVQEMLPLWPAIPASGMALSGLTPASPFVLGTVSEPASVADVVSVAVSVVVPADLRARAWPSPERPHPDVTRNARIATPASRTAGPPKPPSPPNQTEPLDLRSLLAFVSPQAPPWPMAEFYTCPATRARIKRGAALGLEMALASSVLSRHDATPLT